MVINGIDISKYNSSQLAQFRKRNIGFVFQHFELMQQYDVMENIELPLLANGCPGKERKEKVCQISEALDLQDIARKYPSELSGGQQQRVALARALIHNPEVSAYCKTHMKLSDGTCLSDMV